MWLVDVPLPRNSDRDIVAEFVIENSAFGNEHCFEHTQENSSTWMVAEDGRVRRCRGLPCVVCAQHNA